MSLETDLLLDRRRLKRRLLLWRVVAVLAVLGCALLVVGRGVSPELRGHVARLNVTGIITENGGSGVFSFGPNVLAIVSGSSLVRNASSDFSQALGAVIRTAGNNAVTGRGPGDVTGALTPNPLK